VTRAAGAAPGSAPGGLAESAGKPAGGTLFVVATPIGNLADVTLRALEVLRSAPLIAAEDTRLTHRLLARHAIETRMTSYHARSGPARAAALLNHLRAGEDLALVTDAGTPGVSDPGLELVAAWAGEDGLVIPIPGPSAVLAAVVASGISGPRWAFEGFLPRSGRERRDRIDRIAADERGTILYEAPGRVAATLADLAAACGPERPAAVCRELTKLHETIERGSLGRLAELAADGVIPARGEFTIVVGAAAGVADRAASRAGSDDALSAARAEVERLVGEGSGRAQAARRVAAATGLSRRKLYDVRGETGR
jgi:16S rRNA (cytidine1402-2'-O)-methyltransferase